MNPTSIATEILFGLIRPEAVFDWKDADDVLYPTGLGKKPIPSAYLEATHQHRKLIDHGDEEKGHTFLIGAQEMAKGLSTVKGGDSLQGMFRTLLHVVDRYLVESDGKAIVRYEKLLPWRMLTTQIGQDLPICGYLAWKDELMGRERLDFTWPLHLPCDHSALRAILQKGIAENHYHLWGSVPSFHLIWLRLMGDAGRHEEVLAEANTERLSTESATLPKVESWPLHSLSRLAASIRLYLHSQLTDSVAISEIVASKCEQLGKQICNLLENADPSQLLLSALESQVNVVTESFWNGGGMGYAVDYALPKGLHAYNENDGMLLASERYFLYSVWRKLLSGKFAKHEGHLFYVYLLIKAKVRREYVQVNDRVGFHNFKNYQDRKAHYKKATDNQAKKFFDFWGTRLALTRPLSEMPINMLEARIAPESSAAGYENLVKQLVEAMQMNLNAYLKGEEIHKINPELPRQPLEFADRFCLVVHFLKKPDTATEKFASARHWKLRTDLKRSSHDLWEFETSGSNWAGYIRGIDAASGELGCRPEVFAHAFRFLRLSQPMPSRLLSPERIPEPKQLRVTYHVGEDFLDIIDGLRAIDEAIFFLDYRRGDRLGHALALGVTPRDSYHAKHHVVMLSRQELVDNLAWMHGRLVEIGDDAHLALMAKLQRDWKKYYRELIDGLGKEHVLHSVTIHDYFEAWKLRGDDPECYGFAEYKEHKLLQPWEQASILRTKTDELEALRNSPLIATTYHHYHYNQRWKTKGAEMVAYDIEDGYIAAATRLQQYIQQLVLEKGIGIEANPSSNYLIGTFRRYDKHPLPTLYNLGLTYDAQKLAACPQLSISINTDDLGIFDTSLENEYALMAAALERMKNPDGTAQYSPAMIMDWIDRVRGMGVQQSFRKAPDRR
jgi:adenosine deaminase